MSIEDRVRAATRARTDLVHQVRPLELPDELPARGRRRGHTRPARSARHWLNWGAPLAAAALVTALALVLVLLRQPPVPQPGPATPTSLPPAAAAIPRYYVGLVSNRTPPEVKAVVGDDQTGGTVAVLNPTAGQNFYGVTGAADDRTFVLVSYAATQESTWYLLRIAPGTAHPTQLTKLPIQPVAARMAGLALSPDGRELAVMWRTSPRANSAVSLAVYSMSSGAVLHTWITRGDDINATADGANEEALAWVNGNRSLDFRWSVYIGGFGNGTGMIRTIDVTAPGSDLLADSRVAVQTPFYVTADKTKNRHPCPNEVTAGDGTVVCGTESSALVSFEEVCSTVPPSFVTYSGTTGKQLKVLYQWHGQCLFAAAVPLWTDPAGRHVIASLSLSEKGIKMSLTDEFGLVADGQFTALPKLVVGEGPGLGPGALAF